ncbi:S-adenosyl-L-methionine-dependent tRNA 4-demethylwyosine synthase [Cyclospora cayetanensis]|uniref:S-adenosyl-L-methionine-dependent tRNA 4-demethylwyosine synthase n=1 Tax=Cyclospora cayetanensis TaxID=88456 RepID=A0A6P6RWI1_9EIME|nr:S-adenosyl-L-methionine-dependent tRNA 4-demethylwyosine synthase [Cyclospora cayetanensis]
MHSAARSDPAGGATKSEAVELPEQLTARMRANLGKEGYKLVGTHSAVKLCRWTRAALRGRGGCYKHTFYGIMSYGCMEFTSSVACANRCLFCWRHHTNLAAADWRWKQDDPKEVLREAMQNHLQTIKELKGLPGLRSDFFSQVQGRVLHCALSLVGEPIMYPRLNELVHLMHQQGISTFLVTNAQHPDALRALDPVTQLYLSIDAATEQDLKRLDRPIHRDYWARFLQCVDILRSKKQRTVFRLTLVHGYNCVLGPLEEEGAAEPAPPANDLLNTCNRKRGGKRHKNVTSTFEGYAALVRRGEPDLIEIKGMTFCGGLDKESLSMKNVPRHQQGLCKALPEGVYALASEHEHSCCVLLALNGSRDFTGLDYCTVSPSWAVFGAEGRGFDPYQKRVFGKGRRRKLAQAEQAQ